MNYIVIGFYLALGVTIFGLATLALIVGVSEFVRWRQRRNEKKLD